MLTNIVDGIVNIAQSEIYDLQDSYFRSNRANSVGDALEKYIVDSFSGTINELNENIRFKKINEVFSYLGNDSNPLKSDLGGASQKETAIKNATNTLIQPIVITDDPKATVTGNTNGQVSIKSAEGKAKQIVNAVVKALSNIQSVAKEFEALDEQIGQNLPKPLGDYVNG